MYNCAIERVQTIDVENGGGRAEKGRNREREKKKFMGRKNVSQPARFDLITFLLHFEYLSHSLAFERVSSSSFATLTFNGNHLITFTSDMEH